LVVPSEEVYLCDRTGLGDGESMGFDDGLQGETVSFRLPNQKSQAVYCVLDQVILPIDAEYFLFGTEMQE